MTADAFDILMSNNDPALLIVTTVADGERSGCLVGFHTQCGMVPSRYALWLSKPNHTRRVGARADTFAAHWIPADRRDLAELFGGETGDDADKLARCAWSAGPGGVPLLDGCPDRFVGRLVEWIETDADHDCAVVEPTDAQV
jgi:flavin reductase (DIM6/NTAB) family NADH-FMN oxidoreductase RutF